MQTMKEKKIIIRKRKNIQYNRALTHRYKEGNE